MMIYLLSRLVLRIAAKAMSDITPVSLVFHSRGLLRSSMTHGKVTYIL